MDRRSLIVTGAAALAGGRALAQDQAPPPPNGGPPPTVIPGAPPVEQGPLPPAQQQPPYGGPQGGGAPPAEHAGPAPTYSNDEIVNGISDFLGVAAETAGAVIERLFKENGRPTGYVAGEEASGAFGVGLRYGRGLLYMKNRQAQKVFWQGPSIGFDVGGNAGRDFILCYNLQYPDAIYRRFPGVEGSAYFIGGMGITYHRAEDITLAPVRAGVGLRLGADVGYLAFSRSQHIVPL